MASTATFQPAPPPPDEFDPLEFWIRHRSRILLYGGLLIFAGLIYLAYWWSQTAMREKAAQSLAAAASTEDFRKVADQYPHTTAGGNALLLLAEHQRSEGKLDDSSATLQSFLQKHPKHPLLSGAYTSLAANQEAQGKLDDALATYKKVTTGFPNSFSVAAAYLAQGRILTAQGKAEEARHAYETVIASYPESLFREEASVQLAKLKK